MNSNTTLVLSKEALVTPSPFMELSGNVCPKLYTALCDSEKKFGIFGEERLTIVHNNIEKASKEHCGHFKGEYDNVLIENIHNALEKLIIALEIKSAKFMRKKHYPEEPDADRMLSIDHPEWSFNFQHLKLKLCDLLIFQGFFSDGIRFWIMTPKEAAERWSVQSSGTDPVTGAKIPLDYQIPITYNNFDKFSCFEVKEKDLPGVILGIYRGIDLKDRIVTPKVGLFDF